MEELEKGLKELRWLAAPRKEQHCQQARPGVNELRSIIEEKFGFSAPRDADEEKRINSIRVNAFKKWFNSKWNNTMKEFDVWYYTNIINDTEETQKMHENLLNMDSIIGEFVEELIDTTEFNAFYIFHVFQ